MSLDNIETVDAVGTERESGAIVLSLVDSWDWLDQPRHLRALQDKLNAYFGFVESGQLYEAYPEAQGRPLRIEIITRHPLPEEGLSLFEKAVAVASELEMSMTYRAP